jgi:hypothetical protein
MVPPQLAGEVAREARIHDAISKKTRSESVVSAESMAGKPGHNECFTASWPGKKRVSSHPRQT